MSDLTLGDLTMNHVGERVAIDAADATITGILRGFTVETDWIEDRSLDQDPDDVELVPGRRTMTVTVGRWTATNLPLNAPVTRHVEGDGDE